MTLVYVGFDGTCWRYELHQASAPETRQIGARLFRRKGPVGALTLYEEVCG